MEIILNGVKDGTSYRDHLRLIERKYLNKRNIL